MEPKATDRLIRQGRVLVRAIDSLEAIDSKGPFESAATWFLLRAYRHRLRSIVVEAPAWAAEEIIGASEQIGDDRPVQWISPN